jgi:hypothetical protein
MIENAQYLFLKNRRGTATKKNFKSMFLTMEGRGKKKRTERKKEHVASSLIG